MDDTTRILQAVPVLPALNMQHTLDYFETMLGFAVIAHYDGYALVERDGVEIHFFESDDEHLSRNSSCYIRVGNIQKLYSEYTHNRVNLVIPLEAKPWGMNEFSVIDVNGNLLRFGEPLDIDEPSSV